MAKPSSRRDHFRPTVFKLMATKDKLTAASGLATIMEVFDQSPLSEGFRNALPKRSTANGRSGGSYRLGLIQLNSFLYGHDCLDDLEEFRDDPLLEAAMKGKSAAPRTIADFLRDFTEQNRAEMNVYLSEPFDDCSLRSCPSNIDPTRPLRSTWIPQITRKRARRWKAWHGTTKKTGDCIPK